MYATIDEQDVFFRTVLAPDCPVCGSNPCYSLCPNSLDYYSPEQEREDALMQDAMSDSEWMAAAIRQYEQVHGPDSYCS